MFSSKVRIKNLTLIKTVHLHDISIQITYTSVFEIPYVLTNIEFCIAFICIRNKMLYMIAVSGTDDMFCNIV